MKPQALASALTKISGGANAIPQKDLRSDSAVNSLFIVPAVRGHHDADPHGHPPLARAAPRAARPHPGRARPARPPDVRWLDAVTGRRRQAANNLDALFLVPSAAITLQTAAGFAPTGAGSVCYRSAPGAAFDRTQDEITRLLDDDPEVPDVTISADEFGFTWLVVRGDPTDMAGLCTDLHAVNTSWRSRASRPACCARW